MMKNEFNYFSFDLYFKEKIDQKTFISAYFFLSKSFDTSIKIKSIIIKFISQVLYNIYFIKF